MRSLTQFAVLAREAAHLWGHGAVFHIYGARAGFATRCAGFANTYCLGQLKDGHSLHKLNGLLLET